MRIISKYHFNIGLGVAFLAFAFDQLHKWVMLEVVGIAERPPIEVTSFFRLVMVWNRGVSFGMFSDHGEWGPVFLIAVALAVTLMLLQWLTRTTHWPEAAATGLVIGGAMGNVVDRLRFGAVADFFDVFIGSYHWPAFNVADSAICIGVILLCYRTFFPPRARAPSSPPQP